MGVCNTPETNAGDCDFNQWQMDNQPPGGRDFVLFTFNQTIYLNRFTVTQTTITADSDWSWAISATALTNPNGMTLTDVPGPVLNEGQTSSRTINTVAANNGIRSILIGIGPKDSACTSNSSAANCDYFKLLDISGSTVPEPASMAVMGAGLLALGYLARRRHLASVKK